MKEWRGNGKLRVDSYGWVAVGKKIATVTMDRREVEAWGPGKDNDDTNMLVMSFDDGSALLLFDRGQSCCERRYLSTDDDLSKFTGARFLGVEVREGDGGERGEQSHETEFMLVHTSVGTFTCVSHNEHNGYYGGISLAMETVEAAQ